MNPLKRLLSKINLRLTIVVLIIFAIFGAILYFFVLAPAAADKAAGGGFGGGPLGPFGGGKGGPKVQAVSAAEVKVMDVPIWINAIGTMIPKNLVTVHSRVDGELQKLNFTEGQQVKAGQLLAEIDPRPLQAALLQANGQFARDSAQLKNAQLDLERYKTLLEKDSISRQQVDTQEALVRQYQGTVEVDKGLVANAQLQLAYTRITAPVSGRIGLRQVDPGNIIHSGDTNGIVVIAQVQPITAVFALPEINLPLITQALTAKEPTPVEVWDRELKNKLANGKLLTADNQIDTATGTLKLKAEFKNDDSKLFPNQFVNVRLSAGTANNAKVVPASAVLRGQKGSYVYVIDGDKVKTTPVTLGTTMGDLIVVEGDLTAGAKVVTDGADKLRDGAQIEVITADARKKLEGDGKRKGRRGDAAAASAANNSATPDAKAAPSDTKTSDTKVSDTKASEPKVSEPKSNDSKPTGEFSAEQKEAWKKKRAEGNAATSN